MADGPKISLFTPTHDPRYLWETWHSLQFQDYDNFQWVIVPNQQAVIPPGLAADPRVLVTEPCRSTNIGGLKRFACDHCDGEILAELDHDDLLAPGILWEVARAFDRGADFIYSDVGLFTTGTYQPTAYSGKFGWEPYPCQIYERFVWGSRAFEANPRTLCEIYYAPDHIRCWSRRAYYLAGGHNAELSVGDDHQLLIKTYLAGCTFQHLPRVGYLYRLHPENTVKTRNDQIQEVVAQNRLQYLEPLAREWCRRRGLQVVDLAVEHRAGRWSFDRPPAYDEDSVGLMLINQGLQFVAPEQQVAFFNAAYKALAPGGWLSGCVPSTTGWYAHQDPRHKTFFNLNSLRYYAEKSFAGNNPEIACRFQIVQNMECFLTPWYKDNHMKIIQFDLWALKGQRQPGRVLL